MLQHSPVLLPVHTLLEVRGLPCGEQATACPERVVSFAGLARSVG